MKNEPPPAGRSPRKRRAAATLLTVALALLAFLAFRYFSASGAAGAEEKLLRAWIGARAPDFVVTNLDGRAVRLSDFKGRRVILNFWATWCPPCQAEIPAFIRLRAETSPTHVVILGLSTDAPEVQRVFALRHGVNYPLAVLRNVPAPYSDLTVIPVTLVIDEQGVIQNAVLGPQDLKTLEQFAASPDFNGGSAPGLSSKTHQQNDE
ncbi:MAG TPA: TlpA disulfide reductase family protein [Verrucomicrobiae bacterium]|nr:TlpA disulfide reductase family protein [Verrucomicrobiae bacterium]